MPTNLPERRAVPPRESSVFFPTMVLLAAIMMASMSTLADPLGIIQDDPCTSISTAFPP